VLRSLAGSPPFVTARDLLRRLGVDCSIEVDGNAYSVPWRLIGERVRVSVGRVRCGCLHAGGEVAVQAELKGRHGGVTDDAHLAGIAGTKTRPVRIMTEPEAAAAEASSALRRPLADYEAAIGGGHLGHRR
jgi:hypothetical protein